MPAIDVAMPTWNSAPVVEGTLSQLGESTAGSPVDVDRLLVFDNGSDDDTVALAEERAESAGWTFEADVRPCSLPEARQRAIDAVETEWFLFLDDDVRVSEEYLETLFGATAPLVGGVQGRKRSRGEHPSDWTRRRARRAGTHATLLRRRAVEGVSFPSDLAVLEDEYLRRHVDANGHLWVFNHLATFEHASQDRHPIGWEEGYLGGKYGLSTFHDVALNVPYAAVTGRDPRPHAERAAGWVAGRARTAVADAIPIPSQ
jgi:glycosyltransferase involved in cell wall biosynthesis